MSAYEWLIGTRYLRSTHRRGFVSFVALMSVCGLTLGVATLIVVLSVMNGFERELRTRILSVTAHATIMGLDGSLADWQALQQRGAAASPGVQAAVPYIEEQAMLANGRRIAGANVRGVLPEQERTADGPRATGHRRAASTISRPAPTASLLGSALAHELDVQLGGPVVLIAPEGTATPTGVVPRMRRFHVVGIFDSGMYEFDRGLALVHMTDAARLFRSWASASPACAWRFTDPLRAPRHVRDGGAGPRRRLLRQRLDPATTRISSAPSRSPSRCCSSSCSMMVAVAAFNIVATLVMIVKEKQTDIAILRTLGAGPRNILVDVRGAGRADRPGRHALRRGARHVLAAQSAGTGRGTGAPARHRSSSMRACIS